MQYGPGYSQGTERYISILTGHFRKLGHCVQILAGDPAGGRPPGLALGSPVSGTGGVFHYPSYGWMAVEGIPSRELEALISKHAPDIVHIVNPGHVGTGALRAARRLGVPAVVTVVDYWWLCPKHTLWHASGHQCSGRVPPRECLRCIALEREHSWRRGIAKRPALGRTVLPVAYAARWTSRGIPLREIGAWRKRQVHTLAALNQADSVIFLSRTGQQILGESLAGPRSFLITNGLEEYWFNSAARGGAAAGPTTIGFAGALTPHKGPHVLLTASRELERDVRLRIAGGTEDAAYHDRLERLAAGLSVEFVGKLAPAEMPAFMQSIDVLVVPSLWPENLPMVVLEAYASGTPVIGSRVGGIAEYVGDESMLFEPDSVESLQAVLGDWLARGKPASVVQVKTADRMAAETFRVYEESVARKRSNSRAEMATSSSRSGT